MADMMVINKAEGDDLQRAQAARREYASALHMFPSSFRPMDTFRAHLLVA